MTRSIVQSPAGPVTLVCCATTKGPITIAVHHAWAPHGAARFLAMVRGGFFSSRAPLFRAIEGFLVQFGLSGDPAVQSSFDAMGAIPDDPQWLPAAAAAAAARPRFQRGYVSFAGSGPHSRATQLFIALADSDHLGGAPWEVPLGRLVGAASGAALARVYTGYGDAPEQGRLRQEGAAYVEREFPRADWIERCAIMPAAAAADTPAPAAAD